MTLKSPLRGIQAYRRRHDALYGGGQYYQKVLRTGPLAYWPLWEASGTVAQCLVNAAQNGTYSSDVSTWPVGDGIGDGNTAPGFDGTNDYVNILTAAYQAAFSVVAGTVMIWGQVSGAGVWTDGSNRIMITGANDANNYFHIRKDSGNNQVRYMLTGSTVTGAYLYGMTDIDFACFHMTWQWSAPNMNIGCWKDGTNVNNFNVAGQFLNAPTTALIGAGSAAPISVYSGGLAGCAFWDRVLPQATIKSLVAV